MILNDTVTLKRSCRNDLRFRRSSPIFDIQKIQDKRKNKKKRSTDFLLSIWHRDLWSHSAIKAGPEFFRKKTGKIRQFECSSSRTFFRSCQTWRLIKARVNGTTTFVCERSLALVFEQWASLLLFYIIVSAYDAILLTFRMMSKLLLIKRKGLEIYLNFLHEPYFPKWINSLGNHVRNN